MALNPFRDVDRLLDAIIVHSTLVCSNNGFRSMDKEKGNKSDLCRYSRYVCVKEDII